MLYSSRYVHKISPSAKDVGPQVLIPDASTKPKVAAALRRAGILHAGGSIREMRHEKRQARRLPLEVDLARHHPNEGRLMFYVGVAVFVGLAFYFNANPVKRP